MYVADITEKEIKILKSFNGKKTIKEITELLNIENKSNENIRTFLDRNNINYKFERKSYAPKRSEFFMPQLKQEKGLELEVGRSYNIRDNSYNKDEKVIYEGVILKKYPRYYLGKTKSGYCFTVTKFPNKYEVKEIKKEALSPL